MERSLTLSLWALLCILSFPFAVEAQNPNQPTTDPAEVRALNSIFQQWGLSSNYQNSWNASGEPCTGVAIDNSTDIKSEIYNPFIICNCSFDNNSTCHITKLKVLQLNVSGVLPDELWTLTYLTDLLLMKNHLTGPLPTSIGNLTRMQFLDIGHNALWGEIPKEVGLLTDLIMFAIGTNNFSGPLPDELGNCSKLEMIYIDSSGISGQIPSTFANLRSMRIMYASNTGFTGKIPDFIGNWSNFTTLRLQGNSFEGPIPSTFANLTSMKELRINGLTNGGSLAFIKDMKSLEVLDLRYNNISDVMPSTIGEYQNLTWLDLSFNSITGQIPDSLFNLRSLIYLSLGNNKLNGSLPSEKSASLQNMHIRYAKAFIAGMGSCKLRTVDVAKLGMPTSFNLDVSYNNLAGIFPSWINQRSLSINLVANNFRIGQNNSNLPSWLECLQQDFPCSRGAGIYSRFAINCGGATYPSSDRTLFEWDGETLGSASYYVTDTKGWAVSNVGSFTGTNPPYIISSSSPFTNTSDPVLFQSARTSASSLRYYGLGLENGDYTVRLQFAETQITNANASTWESLGRRIFDIYIQGNRVSEDFDIKKEAGGFSNFAVIKEFKAHVSENYLEIHLFWAGKGTCCVPREDTYGPSISAILATLDLPTSKKSRAGLIVGIVVGVGALGLLSVAAFCILRRRRAHMKDDKELLGIDAGRTFSYGELKAATEDFNPANKLGEGGFGSVYKGKLDDGRAIAVKRLSVASHQGKSEFVTEIATISAVQHRNLVKLYGCCIEANKRLLVGYLAPEYAMRGHLTEKTDVFAFGVVALEIVSGRPNSDSSLEQVYLLEWAWHLYENEREVELVDRSLLEFNVEEAKRVIGIALLCTQTSPMQRPSMSQVVAMLSRDTEVNRVIGKPGYLTEWRFDDSISFTSSQATGTSTLSFDTCTSTSTTIVDNAETSTSIVDNAEKSPTIAAKPLLTDIIMDGR
ncbi:hypothetical protein COLO4_38354 [Corchorus olitorius]|uniref:non-specific serine/threonine protein kinase n=1 Tax=Corchorus olitorius TaxID=93759 RepID=A0A1R3FVQ6_9ROSI|nr:hypothetical protein COLO4_38354 [Corchorus olitorius]